MNTCFLLGHRKGVGKDFCADLANIPKLSFAAPLKRLVEWKYDLPKGFCDVQHNKLHYIFEDGSSLREVLVAEGMLGRRFDPNVWINKLSSHIYDNFQGRDIVVSDYRFPNEANLSIPHRIIRVLVTRPGWDPVGDEADDALSDIPSDWDYHITNTTADEVREQWSEIRSELSC